MRWHIQHQRITEDNVRIAQVTSQLGAMAMMAGVQQPEGGEQQGDDYY